MLHNFYMQFFNNLKKFERIGYYCANDRCFYDEIVRFEEIKRPQNRVLAHCDSASVNNS